MQNEKPSVVHPIWWALRNENSEIIKIFIKSLSKEEEKAFSQKADQEIQNTYKLFITDYYASLGGRIQ